MDRLSPLSTAFLDAEDVDPDACLAIGSFAVFEGPAPAYEEFVEAIRGRLPLIPRYRQRLHRVPFDLVAPSWVDDADFDIRWHVRQTALPAPGGPEEIGEFLSRVMSRRMNRNRPLWEYWFCTGLADGRWGVLSKLHHSLVDGVSGSDLYQLVLDPTPTPRGAVPDSWQPARPPSPVQVAAEGVRELVSSPVAVTDAVGRLLAAPVQVVRRTAASGQGLLTLLGAVRPVHSTSLMGSLDGSRRYAWMDVSLDDVRRVRKAFGVTVNDVALTVVTGGFQRLLVSRGETLDAHSLRSLVPVSTRAAGQESILDNRVSLMLPYLPVDVADPVERLRTVHDRITHLRAAHEPEAGGSLTDLAGIGPFAPVSWGIRLGLRLPQRNIATVTTNVPGPRETLYALGREAVAMLPYVPIADRVRVGVAIYSYRGTLTFGLTGDYRTVDDLDVLRDGITEAMDDLLGAATASRRTSRA